ncbi:Glutamate racemase 2 [bioreactor metagenome]|uniref:Glutamate racemase 2 n=1 Tax=bioreactor metagenome TaxID=1076179 RepID=A0A645FZ32_9ZZZZ
MEPAVKPAVEKSTNTDKRVLVFATDLTLKEDKFKRLVSKVDCENKVDFLPLGGLVQFAESFNFDEATILNYLSKELSAYDLNSYGTVVLGCTHFPLYRNMFQKLLPHHIDIIDGNMGTVKNLKRILQAKNYLDGGSGKITFYHSGNLVYDDITLNKYKEILNMLNC